MFGLNKNRMKVFVKDIGFILTGCLLTAAGLVMFTIPNHIAPGGSSGLATSIGQFVPLSIGVLTWMVNLPILIAAYKILGKMVMIKTLIASTALSALMDMLTLVLPVFTDNPLMAAVLGGILIGVGIAILFMRGVSMGGTDLLSIMLGKIWPDMSIGYILMVCDTMVVVIAAFVFKDLEVFLYSIITVFVASKAIDVFMDGMNYAKVIFIITDKGQEIANRLNEETENGCTLIPATGSYTGKEKEILMAVVRPNTAAQTLELAREIDGELFAFIASAAEVHGKGFRYYRADGSR